MRDRQGPLRALTLALCLPLAAGAAPVASVDKADVSATVTDLRSTKGQVLACLTTRPDAFPDCAKDPHAFTRIVRAGANMSINFGAVPDGRYAIALVHDENGNGKLDKRLMIPREGFGFSRDAPVRMGPPSFAEAAFPVGGEDAHVSIRMRYIL